MAQVTETVARGILAGHGYTDNEVRQLAHHWLATHGQAPAYEAGWKDGYKQGAWSATAPTAKAAECVPAPAPPPECETEAEKRAFAFGWFKALESERMKADNKKKGPL